MRFLLLLFWLIAAPAHASVRVGDVVLDPANQVRTDLLARTVAAWSAHPEARRDVLAVVDFSMPSTQPRLFLIDLHTGAVEAYRTAHGRGSDSSRGNTADRFSNDAQSLASSLGAYLTAKRYFGKHGLSLALDGMEPTNSHARARAIVLHSAPYMSDEFVAAHGRPGRSWGCFVVDPGAIDHVVTRLENGALIYAGA